MNYSEQEIAIIKNEDFTTYFVCSLGLPPLVIDILTIVHHHVDFDDAEKEVVVHSIGKDISLKLVPYSFLKDIKLRSKREKDLWDIARLEELRGNK